LFILRPSSPMRLAESSRAPVISAAPADDSFGGDDLSLPDTYGVDMVRAMLQDPFRVFIYWEVREQSLEALTRYFPAEDIAGFRVVLRLIEVRGGNEAFFEVARRGRYWMTVFPDREYEFEIGVRSPVHGYIALVRSNRVRTPRGTVSPETAEEGDYRLSPPDFIDILEKSGFAADQGLSLTVAGMPGEADHSDLLRKAILALRRQVRDAVMRAATGGVLTAEMIEGLPEPLRTELMKLLLAAGGELASIGLIHYLPELLREAAEDNRDWIGDHIRPLHLTPRFFLGGTENLTWPGGEIRWPTFPPRPSSPWGGGPAVSSQ
jgi:hypothetical protein